MTGETVVSAVAAPPSAVTGAATASSSAALPLPLALTSSAPSEEMRSLLEGQKKVHDQILKLQAQIEEEEAAYLDETSHGNIIRGWDGFIDSKQSRKDAALKKVKPYTESEHLFSSCCFYKTLAHEPTLELADYYPRDESAAGARRRNSASSSSGTASVSAVPSTSGGASGRPTSTASSLATASSIKLERKASFSATGSATPPTLGRPPKIKKRKRLDRLEVVSTASATQSETGEEDEPPSTSARLKKSQSTASDAGGVDSGDFVDML